MNNGKRKKIISVLAAGILIAGLGIIPASAGSFGKIAENADLTEGGHLETDFGVNFMAEWWYLNGKATLVSSDGEKKKLGFFVVLAHQESPLFKGYSQLLTFNGLYFDNGTTAFDYIETFVPKQDVNQYIALHTPYVGYRYPDGSKQMVGSPQTGYYLKYTSNHTGMDADLLFQTNVEKTVDHSESPLNFTTYEHSYGTLYGSIVLDGKKYNIIQAEGYMDHMIPVSSVSWAMDMHGWNWFEATTKNYQAVAYAIRGLNDGYENYSYKHLTLLNKHTGEVLAEYSADEVHITETDWVSETEFNRKRPSSVTFSVPGMSVAFNAENVINFNLTRPTATGFVDFMAFQPEDATIQYNDTVEKGSAFYEYLVSDMGVLTSTLK